MSHTKAARDRARKGTDKRGIKTSVGKALPFGASPDGQGTQFVLFSRHTTRVSLLLFESPEHVEPFAEIPLDPKINRTGDVWHIRVEGANAGALYLYRVDGPYQPEEGQRFNRNKLLLDPYAKAVTGTFNRLAIEPDGIVTDPYGFDPASPQADLSFSEKSNAAGMPKCIVVSDDFDWQGDRPLNYPLRQTIIYETHIRGLTRHPSCRVEHPGTYRGVIQLIPHFKQLGVTSLEFLPLQEFDEFENRAISPSTGEPLQNYWGYSTFAYFAPKGSYCSSGSMGEQVKEFKQMVRELHKAGLEVILDVVFNHTAELDELGPTLFFRGLDNSIYYLLDRNPRLYKNFSGCGNTVNCNHPVVRSFILDCLRYWVMEMHVDGFRFDLASVLGRDRQGNLMENPPIIERIAEDPVLRNSKLIAEAWDAAGTYQVGQFPGGRWAEWNDKFRDDVRRFWRGDPNAVPGMATRFTGSADLYGRGGRKPFQSVNYITSHDGFTLNDLVSYADKHNLENGEQDRDGMNENLSSNYGIEGETDDHAVNRIRESQLKNLLLTLLLSLGTPMLLGGDEMRRTQGGNNNAYCQNNEISWYNWDLKKQHGDVFRFCRELISFRRRHAAFTRPKFYEGKDTANNTLLDITWFDESGGILDWSKSEHTLCFLIDGSKAETAADREDNDFFIILNALGSERKVVITPARTGTKWFLAVDTSRESPADVLAHGEEVRLRPQDLCIVRPRSAVVLLSR